ncbi:uncharacterized protein LOC115173641 isoform X2 [Salmo trutta]|uniref:uncharacterized protein LOC115173641 isoform X2 n=1 Tax=Salmo trutta TaxID=8032 RepID=UPI001131C4EA|nr:uncharacterized protein LOC115173641 isoform X2 [Salmo trutta]
MPFKFRESKMPWPLIFLLCWSYVLKATHTSIITQTPGSLMVKAGDTVTLKCYLVELITYCYLVIWMKVDPRTGTLIKIDNLKIDNNSEEGKGKQDKLCSATITKATVSDSGMYYCSAVQSDMIHTGNGSRVVVTERERTQNITESPAIKLLSPSDGDGSVVLTTLHYTAESFIPLLCLVLNVVPSQVHVFWLIDGREDSGLTLSTWTDNNDSATEFTMNQILVQAEEWNRGVQYSTGMCTMVLYWASAAALLTIIVAVTVAVCLYRGHPVVTDVDTRQRGTGPESRQHQSGRLGEARKAVRSSISEVQYATLDHIQLGRRPNTIIQ